MTDINKKIIDLIKSGASANEISDITGLSNKQLFYRLNMLKIKGYDFSREYYYCGEIVYNLKTNFKKQNEVVLLTNPKDNFFRAILISDLHFGNVNSTPELLDKIYDFCKKENIHIIINGGDLIDGLLGLENEKTLTTYEEQIEYCLKRYPFDPYMLNFVCLGNHDYDALVNGGQNLETALLNRRNDIVVLGYGAGTLKIKNDEIIVMHGATPSSNEKLIRENKLIVYGHTHKSSYFCDKSNLNATLYIPTLSRMTAHDKIYNRSLANIPSFVKANIEFKGGYFSNAIFEQFIFADNNVYKVNESYYNLYYGKKINEPIHNESPRVFQKKLLNSW